MFVGRLPDGSIYGVWANEQPKDAFHANMEELPETHADVVAFRNRPKPVVRDIVAELQSRVDALDIRVDGVASSVEIKSEIL